MNVIRLWPYSSKAFFDSRAKHLLNPAYTTYSDEQCHGVYHFLYALGESTVRHTKQQVLDGDTILELPEKTVELVPVQLSPDEKARDRACHLPLCTGEQGEPRCGLLGPDLNP